MLTRRTFLGIAAGAAITVRPAFGETFPSRPVKALLGLSPGGGADLLARILFRSMEAELHQPIVLENRPGAGTTLAAEGTARAEPDGYTMYVATGSYVTSAVLLRERGAALQRSGRGLLDALAPVSLMFTAPYCIAARRGSGLDSIQDVLAQARRRPGELTYASSGIGSQPHFAGELFQSATGTRLLHIPYKGLGPAIVGVLGDQVQLVFSDMNSVFPRHRSGEMKILAVTGDARPALAPDIPTMKESGIAGMDIAAWQGYLVPARTPAARIDVLASAIDRSLRDPAVRDRVLENAGVPADTSPAHFRAFLEKETRLYRRLAESAGIKADY
ncbi:tripartite tricarboxylate transporter substrate binding protein [Pigmentiphaga sp. CHJ604]|uniref:Bug family tripartite tricarboxylate transporter substrate binding protein n=1 Tax=Pigmentiphaga sp. CHJ604 TaxID=3081984 RepID=UPI0030D4E013